jgi:hypothetical protein
MTTSADIRRGILTGIATGGLFAGWAYFVSSREGAVPFRAAHTTVARMVLIYLAVGIVAGALVGGVWRRAHNTAACYLLAVPAAAAAALGIILMNSRGWVTWEFETWSLFAVLVTVGTLVIGNEMNVRRRARAQIGHADT